jgi:hypothetical protein
MGLEPGNGSDKLQPCSHGALGIVLVGFRVAKVREHAVAHVFGDKPVESSNDVCDTRLVGRDHFAQVFRIHAG